MDLDLFTAKYRCFGFSGCPASSTVFFTLPFFDTTIFDLLFFDFAISFVYRKFLNQTSLD